MQTGPLSTYKEHPLDVLGFLAARQDRGEPCALVVLTGTVGGAVRARYALMAVAQSGETCGYLSGGCIDADIALQAQRALQDGLPRTLRYGVGSPFLDIKLPCGGAIDLTIFPAPDRASIRAAIKALTARQMTRLTLSANGLTFTADYRPKLCLRIAGRGHDPVALARLAAGADLATHFWSTEEACLSAAANIPGIQTTRLTTPAALPIPTDDPSTAFILMMHDTDWEAPLLMSALQGKAFYIGAVGSPRTHSMRCADLANLGVAQADIARIHGPIGLVASLRDASMLAISTLAQIVAAFHANAPPPQGASSAAHPPKVIAEHV